jgi:cell division protein ZipA
MDADTLRIVLIVFGALILVGLYLWERRKGTADEEEELDPDAEPVRPARDKREPSLGPWEEDGAEAGSPPMARRAAQSGGEPSAGLPDQGEFRLEPPPIPEAYGGEPPPDGPMILTLHVASLDEPFPGADIVHAAERCGLEPGDMDIYHCVLGEGVKRQVLFSMANMVKPGTFPFGAMAEFSSPGLTLFAQLDGNADDPGRMEELIGTAYSLATDLGGEVRDERRDLFTPAAERSLRERVMAFVHARLTAAESA